MHIYLTYPHPATTQPPKHTRTHTHTHNRYAIHTILYTNTLPDPPMCVH